MPTPADYNPAQNWVEFMLEVANTPDKSDLLPDLSKKASQKLQSTGDIRWALPYGFAQWKLNLFEEAFETLKHAESLAPTNVEYNVISNDVI